MRHNSILSPLFILLLLCLTSLSYSQKTIPIATMEWAVTKTDATTDQGAQAVDMLKDMEIRWTFDNNVLAGSMQMGSFMNTKYFLNVKEDSRKVYMVMMGQKLQATLDEQQFKNITSGMQSQSVQGFEEDSADKKTILGYQCVAYNGQLDQNGQTGKIKVYITKDISFNGTLGKYTKSKLQDNEANEIDGVPVGIELNFEGFSYTMQMIELTEKIDPEMLKQPKGNDYRTMDESMLRQISGK